MNFNHSMSNLNGVVPVNRMQPQQQQMYQQQPQMHPHQQNMMAQQHIPMMQQRQQQMPSPPPRNNQNGPMPAHQNQPGGPPMFVMPQVPVNGMQHGAPPPPPPNYYQQQQPPQQQQPQRQQQQQQQQQPGQIAQNLPNNQNNNQQPGAGGRLPPIRRRAQRPQGQRARRRSVQPQASTTTAQELDPQGDQLRIRVADEIDERVSRLSCNQGRAPKNANFSLPNSSLSTSRHREEQQFYNYLMQCIKSWNDNPKAVNEQQREHILTTLRLWMERIACERQELKQLHERTTARRGQLEQEHGQILQMEGILGNTRFAPKPMPAA